MQDPDIHCKVLFSVASVMSNAPISSCPSPFNLPLTRRKIICRSGLSKKCFAAHYLLNISTGHPTGRRAWPNKHSCSTLSLWLSATSLLAVAERRAPNREGIVYVPDKHTHEVQVHTIRRVRPHLRKEQHIHWEAVHIASKEYRASVHNKSCDA